MARVIAVSGGKGGVGKTNISVNLALCLARHGNKVSLFDADLGLANINVLLGLYPEYDLEDVILHDKSLQDIIIKDYQGIDIIPGSSGVEKLANLDRQDLSRVIELFEELDAYDFFILDTSAGISQNVISFCLAASEVIILITPEPTSLTDAYALLKIMSINGFGGVAKIVVNQCKNTTVASRTYNKFKEVVQKYLAIEIIPLGIIVQDSKFSEAVQKQTPLVTLFPESSAAKCINVMAARLIARESEDFKPVGMSAFWTKFLDFTKSPLQLAEKAPSPPATRPREQTRPVQQVRQETPEEAQSVRSEETLSLDDSIAVSDQSVETQKDRRHTSTETVRKGRHVSDNAPLFEKLETPRSLPTLPHILLKLIEACGKEDTSISDLAKIVEHDPALCAKILRMVNSAYYNLPQKVNTFNQALALLGSETIKNIALSASVYQVFYGLKKDSGFNLKLFWWHSLMCAVIAKLLAKKTAYPKPEDAFLAGLLHDIGKLVLLENFPKQYTEILKTSYGDNTALFTEEQKVLGLSHADTGFWLINRWQMQPFIADAVLYHHQPLTRIAHAFPLVKIIHVANSICSEYDSSVDGQCDIAVEVFHLTRDEAQNIIVQAKDQVAQIAQSLAIEVEAPGQAESFFTDKDKEVQAHLTRQVRDVALLQGTLHNLLRAHDAAAIIRVAQQGLQILFDIKNILFFLYDVSKNMLNATVGDEHMQRDMFNGLAIPLQEGQSLIVTALQQNRITNSFAPEAEDAFTIIDEQVIRLLGSEGMMCLPLVAQQNNVGVVVLGVEEVQMSRIERDLKLFNMFISYTALALHTENVRQQQAKVVLSERLAASTSVAKKVAHEVNNPLGIIKNYLKILELNLSDRNIPHDEVKIINEEINRVANIIDQLSDFSQPTIQEMETVDINALLSDIIMLAGTPLLDSNIQIQTNLAPSLPVIVTGKDGLKQVILNLIKNAAEAIQDNGTIFIATKHLTDSDSIEITVRDDGPGLPDVIKSRLFEPYISTKGKGHTGLGLSIVYSMVRELHGTVTCKTEKGEGTTFTIVLPVASDSD